MKKEPSETSLLPTERLLGEFDSDQLQKIRRLMAQGYSRSKAEYAVVQTTPDAEEEYPPPPIPWSNPKVRAILLSGGNPQYDSTEQALVALREKAAHMTPVELAEFICSAQAEPLLPHIVEPYFTLAFPSLPKKQMVATRPWVRFGAGTMTDEEFNALLQPFIGPKAAGS
jgi:hypothetical protein